MSSKMLNIHRFYPNFSVQCLHPDHKKGDVASMNEGVYHFPLAAEKDRIFMCLPNKFLFL